MEIRLITINEIDKVMEIISDAKELLKPHSLQWQQGYPNKDTMFEDIKNKCLFGYYVDNNLLGIVALVKGLNPYYEKIYEGSWNFPTNEKDAVIHRIAVRKDHHHEKIGDSLIKFAIEYAKENQLISIKSDTHIKNEIMQKLLLDNGFIFKGIIILGRNEEDNSRLAYELDL